MSRELLCGLLIGGLWAVVDAGILHLVAKRAAADRANAGRLLGMGFAARYLLTLAVVALAVLIPGVNAVAVVALLIVQKVVLVVAAVLSGNRR